MIVALSVHVPASPPSLDRVHDGLARFTEECAEAGAPLGAMGMALETAVAEIIANVVRHAGATAFGVAFRRRRDSVEAEVTDDGAPFREGPTRAPEDLPEGGLGLGIARAAMDTVSYRREGDRNVWLLAKRTAP